MDPNGVRDMIVGAAARSAGIERLVLFGSRARGDAEPRSDFDIAADCPGLSRLGWLEFLEALDDLPTLIGIDAVRLDEAPPSLRAEVARTGVVIYDRREAQTIRR